MSARERDMAKLSECPCRQLRRTWRAEGRFTVLVHTRQTTSVSESSYIGICSIIKYVLVGSLNHAWLEKRCDDPAMIVSSQ